MVNVSLGINLKKKLVKLIITHLREPWNTLLKHFSEPWFKLIKYFF